MRYDVARLARRMVDLLLNPAPVPRGVKVPVELVRRAAALLT
ncbi:hypothetical protein [Nonomuraea sp. JJY05]